MVTIWMINVVLTRYETKTADSIHYELLNLPASNLITEKSNRKLG